MTDSSDSAYAETDTEKDYRMVGKGNKRMPLGTGGNLPTLKNYATQDTRKAIEYGRKEYSAYIASRGLEAFMKKARRGSN